MLAEELIEILSKNPKMLIITTWESQYFELNKESICIRNTRDIDLEYARDIHALVLENGGNHFDFIEIDAE